MRRTLSIEPTIYSIPGTVSVILENSLTREVVIIFIQHSSPIGWRMEQYQRVPEHKSNAPSSRLTLLYIVLSLYHTRCQEVVDAKSSASSCSTLNHLHRPLHITCRPRVSSLPVVLAVDGRVAIPRWSLGSIVDHRPVVRQKLWGIHIFVAFLPSSTHLHAADCVEDDGGCRNISAVFFPHLSPPQDISRT